MLRGIHDDAVSDALDEHLAGARVVGIMGGHALERGSAAYAGAARLGRRLTRDGLTVATGGGPGAMEAANLGAYAAPFEDGMLDSALELLAKSPHFTPVDHGVGTGRLRRYGDSWPGGGASVGIPTWFYGHEPPNAFASHIAKYFVNAVREDGLLARSNAGVVFLPGAAGTVQEIFDNATPNYYQSRGEPTPMVLVDRAHWTEKLPAWPLLQALARGAPDGGPDRAGRLGGRGAGGAGPPHGGGAFLTGRRHAPRPRPRFRPSLEDNPAAARSGPVSVRHPACRGKSVPEAHPMLRTVSRRRRASSIRFS